MVAVPAFEVFERCCSTEGFESFRPICVEDMFEMVRSIKGFAGSESMVSLFVPKWWS